MMSLTRHCRSVDNMGTRRGDNTIGQRAAALMATVFLATISATSAIEAIMGQFSLASTDLNAVCNDGSPATYFFRRAQTTQQKDLWVVRRNWSVLVCTADSWARVRF